MKLETSLAAHKRQRWRVRLQEERKGFEQLDEEDRDTLLAQIHPSLRQVIPLAALCPVLCSPPAQQSHQDACCHACFVQQCLAVL